MTDNKTAKAEPEQDGAGVPELVTPVEHAQTTESLDAGQDVSDKDVPDSVEVAARSADVDKPTTEHRKTFVLGPNPYETDKNPYTEANGFDHNANKGATRQYMIDSGLWPTEDVRFVSGKKHPDGESWILTYAVNAIPANDAPEGSQTPRVTGTDGRDAAHEEDKGDAEHATNYASPAESVESTD